MLESDRDGKNHVKQAVTEFKDVEFKAETWEDCWMAQFGMFIFYIVLVSPLGISSIII